MITKAHIESLQTIQDTFSLKYTWFVIDENTQFKIEEYFLNDFRKIEDCQVERVAFIALFYDCTYTFNVEKKEIESDSPRYRTLTGDTKLFDSFEEFLERTDVWETVKHLFKRCEELAIKEEF